MSDLPWPGETQMHEHIERESRTIKGLVGVYNAEGTLRGELTYWVGARLGRGHCGLCDITHGSIREKAEWKRCRAGLPVPFETFHRDDQPDDIRVLLGNALPAVVAQTESGFVLLLGPEQLAHCEGSPARLVDALTSAALQVGLTWTR